ncbi:hypothetical protein PWP93_27300 [Paraburkholderia sp. A1RI-2L]|uniref:hypothetical protein n=1 Tax=Paraburkholderia sp. A1RI-2L TaxID=3028367 RepID=UPI003B82A7A0
MVDTDENLPSSVKLELPVEQRHTLDGQRSRGNGTNIPGGVCRKVVAKSIRREREARCFMQFWLGSNWLPVV